jgi:hypothetical protein
VKTATLTKRCNVLVEKNIHFKVVTLHSNSLEINKAKRCQNEESASEKYSLNSMIHYNEQNGRVHIQTTVNEASE